MRLAFLADLHFGRSETHDDKLLEFADWMLKDIEPVDFIYIAGDTFHSRDKIPTKSLTKAKRFIERVAARYPTKIITGNHDLSLRDSREFNTAITLEGDNISIINNPGWYELGEHMIFEVPWIISEDELKRIAEKCDDMKPGVVVGHFEFSHFAMNDNYTMEHGINHKLFKRAGKVFTGHYHKRQLKDNVQYIGTPFPFDFNDANDSERGYVVYDMSTRETEYRNWNKYSVVSMTAEEFLNSKHKNSDTTQIRVICQEDGDYDKVVELFKETGFAQTKVVAESSKVKEAVENGNVAIESVQRGDDIDTVIIRSLRDTKVEGINSDLLVDIYERVVA